MSFFKSNLAPLIPTPKKVASHITFTQGEIESLANAFCAKSVNAKQKVKYEVKTVGQNKIVEFKNKQGKMVRSIQYCESVGIAGFYQKSDYVPTNEKPLIPAKVAAGFVDSMAY